MNSTLSLQKSKPGKTGRPRGRKLSGEEENQLLATPAGFCMGVLGYPRLYQWQIDTLNPFIMASGPKARLVQVAVRSPNEGGRSSLIISGLATWWLGMHERGKVGITTASQKQLNEQIIPALEANRKKMPDWHAVHSPYYRMTTPRGGRLVAFTTDNADLVEGLHAGDNVYAPLLWVIDEAKSVPDDIFQGVDRCGYNAKLLSSSPGMKRGAFFKAFTEHRKLYHCVVAGLKDCPHIGPEKVNRIIETYGINHPYTRSSIFGEFMDQDEVDRYILSDSELQRCLNNPPQHRPGFRFAFCDFGGTVDEHVIAYRDGNKISIHAAWHEANKEAAAGRFIREFVAMKLSPSQIAGDAADKDMLDLLERAGWPILRQNFGQQIKGDVTYKSWSARAWMEGGAAIARCEWILPKDDTFFAEATTRMKRLDATGKWGAEEKYEMRKRGVSSPNRADSVFGVMAVVDNSVWEKPLDFSNWRDEERNQMDRQVLAEAGASAGYG